MGFKKMRTLAGLTQKEVAERLGINQSTVCLWEAGKTMPRMSLARRIAELYKCTVEDLLKEDE